MPPDWYRDGRLIFSMATLTSVYDLWLLPMIDDHLPSMFLQPPEDQLHGNFSPNGLLVAYSTSQDSGRFEIYVSTTRNKNPQQWKVSINGGYEPRWRADG